MVSHFWIPFHQVCNDNTSGFSYVDNGWARIDFFMISCEVCIYELVNLSCLMSDPLRKSWKYSEYVLLLSSLSTCLAVTKL